MMEKVYMPEGLVKGIYDVELQRLENKADLKLLQNQAASKYIELLQKEIDNLEACSDVRADTSEEEDEDHEQEIVALKIVYTRVYKLMNSKHQNCGEFEKLQAVKDDLKLTFNQRKLELDNVTKQFDALIEDPELKAAHEKLNVAQTEFQAISKSFGYLERDEKNLTEKVNEKEKRDQETMDQKRKELEENMKNLSEAQQYMESAVEEELAAEIVALEEQLKELNKNLCVDDDDVDSNLSELNIDCASLPLMEMVTTDISSFFKNPNDFPELLMNLVSPARDKSEIDIQKTPVKSPIASTSTDFLFKTSENNSNPLKRKHSGHSLPLTPKNFNDEQSKKLSNKIRCSSPQNKSPMAEKRQLRSAGKKRKSQENFESKQPPAKTSRVEILEKSKESSDEIVESSEPEKEKSQKRNSFKKVDKQQNKEVENPIPSTEDPRDPVKDGQSERISIPQTQTDELEKETEEVAQPKKDQEKDNEIDFEDDQGPDIFNLCRTKSSRNLLDLSCFSGSIGDDLNISNEEHSGNNSFDFDGNGSDDANDFFSAFSPDRNINTSNNALF